LIDNMLLTRMTTSEKVIKKDRRAIRALPHLRIRAQYRMSFPGSWSGNIREKHGTV